MNQGAKPSVATYQVPWEFDHLLDLVADEVQSGTVLEVGCYEGGTLWHWLQTAAVVVAVDDEMREYHGWHAWADEVPAELHTIKGSSHDQDIIRRAEELGPYDFIFIDADHTYEAVVEDYIQYAPMLAPGGCIAFHDILPRANYGVADVWAAVKATDGVRYVEIAKNATEPGNEGPCGIGVAWLP